MHESEHLFAGNRHEHVCGAVCGAWWSGPICGDGTPNGYAVYEARGESLMWRYKSTGELDGHQVRLYPPGADPAHPEEFLANVWDWDPEWKVLWYEDGERRGALPRKTGKDPLSVELHTGPDKPKRRKWVEPYEVEHLFRARPARRADGSLPVILVEATDRFGRVHTATLRRG